MMYDSEKDRIREMQELLGRTSEPVKMAKVMAVESTLPVVRFYGESVNAAKKYPYLASYNPMVGDIVVLLRIGRSYIILGKVV